MQTKPVTHVAPLRKSNTQPERPVAPPPPPFHRQQRRSSITQLSAAPINARPSVAADTSAAPINVRPSVAADTSAASSNASRSFRSVPPPPPPRRQLPTTPKPTSIAGVNYSEQRVMNEPSNNPPPSQGRPQTRNDVSHLREVNDVIKEIKDVNARALPAQNRPALRRNSSLTNLSEVDYNDARADHQDRTLNNARKRTGLVTDMPQEDQFGDFGLYTGEVDEDNQPHGKDWSILWRKLEEWNSRFY